MSISIRGQENMNMSDLVKNSFTKIAPFWPLKNLIAVNPLQGLEDLPIEEALRLTKFSRNSQISIRVSFVSK